MGLLDRIMDMVFLPPTGSVVVRSSQGRFFVVAGPGSKKVIFGHPWTILFETN